MAGWRTLLERLGEGLEALKRQGTPAPEWTLVLVRDAFDICVVDALHEDLLRENLRFVSDRKTAIEAAAARLAPDFVKRSLDELDVLPGSEDVAARTHDRILEIVSVIPDA